MKRLCYFVVGVFLLCTLLPEQGEAQLNYGFLSGTGSRMTGAFTILQNGSRAGAGQSVGIYQPSQNLISIGFPFNYAGVSYTQLSICSNGFMTLGGTYGSPATNGLRNIGSPIIAPFWDQLRVPGASNSCGLLGRVQYMVTGSSPNRILVVDFENLSLGDGYQVWAYSPVIFQARLYETSNKIEFYYQSMSTNRPSCETSGGTTASTTASIGLTASGGFLSVTPNGSSASASSTTDNSTLDIRLSTIQAGSLYTFCPAGVTGNVPQGGTARMASGDTLLLGKQGVLSSPQNFTPFTLVSPCASTFTYTIGGLRAGEYSITPSGGALPAGGSTPILTFLPTGLGVREATLTVRDNLGFVVRTYVLLGEGVSRITWIGNTPQGGTPALAGGDTLMGAIAVDNGFSQGFTPITLRVNGSSGPPALITYTLADPTGQFSLDRTSDNVVPGTTTSPVITFRPSGIGPQEATLTVNAEGEIRTFLLRPFARGAGARFSIGSEPLTAGSAVFSNVFACVGEEVYTVEMVIESIGDLPFKLTSSDAFLTESTIGPGRPPFPLLRDNAGEPIPAQDYFISDAAGSKVPLQLPVTVLPGTRKTIYLSFLPTREGKRRARAFFKTNGLNFSGLNTDNDVVKGLLNFELVAQGLGAGLSNRNNENLPEALVFPSTKVRSSSTMTGYIRNSGECDLQISTDDFRLVSGDIGEFTIVSGLRSPKNASGNHVLAPGSVDSFSVSFTPLRSGSRRASIQIKSNDSTLVIPGVTARGSYQLDVYGLGKVGLEARMVNLPPAIIGGPSSTGAATLENTSPEVATITDITITDPNGEIMEDPANPWLLPRKIQPGEQITLHLLFTPVVGSSPGERAVTMNLTLLNGDPVTIDVRGLAGTRELNVTPPALFQGVGIAVGDVRRQFIVVTNTGSFPVKIQEVKLTEANSGDYKVSPPIRSVMESGQTEFFEVTFSPQTPGISNGTVEILSNATNSPHLVALGGAGTATAPVPEGSGGNIGVPGMDVSAIRSGSGGKDLESVNRNAVLRQSTPNPTTDKANIQFVLPQAESIQLVLSTSQGEVVKDLLTGVVEAGEHTIVVDLGNLPSGRYYYTLHTASGNATFAIDLVR